MKSFNCVSNKNTCAIRNRNDGGSDNIVIIQQVPTSAPTGVELFWESIQPLITGGVIGDQAGRAGAVNSAGTIMVSVQDNTWLLLLLMMICNEHT